MNQTNSEMPISSFTLNELITMAGGEKRPGIMGECNAANSASEMEIFRFPSRLNALIIGVGIEGETSLTSNLQEFRLKKDSLFIFSPKHILQVQSNNRFKAHLIVIAPDFLKRISGKSVSEWIDNYVILEAKTLLKYSNMSVQEIAYYLNFPNQSFFGSYFKRNAGMSPSQYKAKK